MVMQSVFEECDDEENIEGICPFCNGSSEGMYDGSICTECDGGVIHAGPSREDWLADRADAINDERMCDGYR